MSEILTRRAALGVLGVSSMALLAACGSKASSEASASPSDSPSATSETTASASASEKQKRVFFSQKTDKIP